VRFFEFQICALREFHEAIIKFTEMISNATYRYSYDNMITNYNKTNSGLGLLHVPGGGISD
jgi:hypothetical protein